VERSCARADPTPLTVRHLYVALRHLRWIEPIKDQPADRVHVPWRGIHQVSHPAAVSGRWWLARPRDLENTRPGRAPPHRRVRSGRPQSTINDAYTRRKAPRSPRRSSARLGSGAGRRSCATCWPKFSKSRPPCPPPQSPRSITWRWLRSSTQASGNRRGRVLAGILAGSGSGEQPTDAHASEGQ
jgi:hypothetical protein